MTSFRKLLFVLLSCGVALGSAAQQSPFLQNPDLFVDYVATNANFWLGVYDDNNGGFYTNVTREGNLFSSRGTDKDVLTQSRNAYAMVRAFQLTGDETFLEYSRGALNFMYQYGWDTTYGGWYNDLNSQGTPDNRNAVKTAFIQHYALLGPMASWEATRSTIDGAWLDTGFNYLDTKLWDSNPVYYGYFDQITFNSAIPSRKSFNATVDAITTHALQLYLATGEEKYKVRLQELAENILTHLEGSMDSQAIGFAEKYNSDWSIRSSETLTIMGHVLKTAWVLGRINQVLPDPRYVTAARKLADHVLERGYDHEYGGPYKDYNRVTGQMQLWGLSDSTKAWWQMEQAITGGLELYRTTRDVSYLNMADETLSFFMDHFQDPIYGEVYSDRTRTGEQAWGDHKGDGYKAAYHSIELGYYGYLYAHLFVTYTPAKLHYFFEESFDQRVVTLSPIADPSSGYTISGVLLDGEVFTGFDATSRVLTVPPGTTGVFEVTFSPTTSIAVESQTPSHFSLESVYPNPAKSSVHVALAVDSMSEISVKMVDMLGRVLSEDLFSVLGPGRHDLELPLDHLPSGVYSIVVSSSTGRQISQVIVSR